MLNSFRTTGVAWASLLVGTALTSLIIFIIKTAYNCGDDCWTLK